jgi:uncharacterized membrane protein (Fun14 family)
MPARLQRSAARDWAARSLAAAAAPHAPPTAPAAVSACAALEAGDASGVAAREDRVAAAVAEQLGVGGALGIATGYAARRLGRAAAVAVGAELMLIQYFAVRGWVTVHWAVVAEDLRPRIGRGAFDGLKDVVLYKLPFAGAFSAGMAAGLRL